MTRLTRTVRTSPLTGITLDEVLSAVFVSELSAPGPDLWLVSPWISDLVVLDNDNGDFDDLFADTPPSACTLSQTLGLLSRQGVHVHVVTRPVEHNQAFLRRLRYHAMAPLSIREDPDMHEKTFCGADWILTGSMNFTINGMEVNDEAMTYIVGGPEAAEARLHFTHRWSDPS
jgi:phosphatidylserine/phosphatidylglycerophosphate/cardiolipin synthase-like enzyme